MSPDALAAQLEAARLRWVPVSEDGDTQQVQIEAPSQFRAWKLVDALRSSDGDALLELLAPIARDWKGITQADLQGAAVGSADPAPFGARLFRLALMDRPRWVTHLAMESVKASKEAADRIKATTGN